VTNALGAPGGIDASYLALTNSQQLSLADLRNLAPKLEGHPLIFINACESAELTPFFYDGFVPYLVARGARGAMGTECEVPALFAAEWAKRFFHRFLAGNEWLGEVVLSLRREFWQDHNNLLGLVYAVYCASHTRVEPGVRLT